MSDDERRIAINRAHANRRNEPQLFRAGDRVVRPCVGNVEDIFWATYGRGPFTVSAVGGAGLAIEGCPLPWSESTNCWNAAGFMLAPPHVNEQAEAPDADESAADRDAARLPSAGAPTRDEIAAALLHATSRCPGYIVVDSAEGPEQDMCPECIGVLVITQALERERSGQAVDVARGG